MSSTHHRIDAHRCRFANKIFASRTHNVKTLTKLFHEPNEPNSLHRKRRQLKPPMQLNPSVYIVTIGKGIFWPNPHKGTSRRKRDPGGWFVTFEGGGYTTPFPRHDDQRMPLICAPILSATLLVDMCPEYVGHPPLNRHSRVVRGICARSRMPSRMGRDRL